MIFYTNIHLLHVSMYVCKYKREAQNSKTAKIFHSKNKKKISEIYYKTLISGIYYVICSCSFSRNDHDFYFFKLGNKSILNNNNTFN